MLGNPAKAPQSIANNATNTMRATNIPGLTPGRYYQAGSQINNGFSFGTPRDFSHGGMQYYDPQYAVALPNRQPSTASYANQQLGGSMARGYNGVKPGGGQSTSTGGGTGMPVGTQMPGMANVSTSITPSAIYPEWMTNAAVSNIQAQADQASNLPYLMKQFDRPGASRSDAHMAAALPMVAQAQTQATAGRASIPFEDLLANQRHLFMGEVARENEALGWGNLAARMQEAQQANYLNDLNRQYSLLSTLVG